MTETNEPETENELIHAEIRVCPECAQTDSLNVIFRRWRGFLSLTARCEHCDFELTEKL